MPAGMSWASTGLGAGTTNTVTVLSVGYRPRSLPAGLTDAVLETAALPSAAGDPLVRADAGVSWFPPRSAAEQLNAASFRSVTITAVQVIPDKRTVTRGFASPAVIGQLVALASSLPATAYPDVAAMSCLAPPSFTGWISPRAWWWTRTAAGRVTRSRSTGSSSRDSLIQAPSSRRPGSSCISPQISR
jgi:hypothetical protein